MKENETRNENENELEDLFEVTLPTEDILREARIKSRIRQVVVSIGTIGLSIVLVWLVHLQITPHLIQQKMFETSFYEGVVGANTYEMPFKRELGFFNGKAEAVQYKILGNQPVVIGSVDSESYDNQRLIQMGGRQLYSESGHKLMQFYNPSAADELVIREFEQLDKLSSNTLIEAGISLDEKTSRSELEALLPYGVDLNWCWVETRGIREQDSAHEKEVIGYPLIDESGIPIKEPEAEWMNYLELIKEKNTSHKKFFEQIYNVLGEAQIYTEEGQLPILGGVVVGTKEELMKLEAIGAIRGFVIGEVITY